MTSRAQTGRRVGILGGTFDPIHVGHLVAAENARYALDLDTVIFMVAGDPWHKSQEREITSAETRFSAVAAAVADEPAFEASRIEIDRSGPTYTADTLEDLTRAQPEAEFFLILGTDAAEKMSSWARLSRVAELATIVVVRRPGSVNVQLDEHFRSVEVDMPALDISSTDLRDRLQDGRPWRYLVPEAARKLIETGWGYDKGINSPSQ